eukprot:Hpha_TRINITY_DN10579_c0_g3::TRINITY_DN10579_c0_g3_i1::g.31316::m.31316
MLSEEQAELERHAQRLREKQEQLAARLGEERRRVLAGHSFELPERLGTGVITSPRQDSGGEGVPSVAESFAKAAGVLHRARLQREQATSRAISPPRPPPRPNPRLDLTAHAQVEGGLASTAPVPYSATAWEDAGAFLRGGRGMPGGEGDEAEAGWGEREARGMEAQ